jgi:hypothetical protein
MGRDFNQEVISELPKIIRALAKMKEQGITLMRALISGAPITVPHELFVYKKDKMSIQPNSRIMYRYIDNKRIAVIIQHADYNKKRAVWVETDKNEGEQIVDRCDECFPPVVIGGHIVCIFKSFNLYGVSIDGSYYFENTGCRHRMTFKLIEEIVKFTSELNDEGIAEIREPLINYLKSLERFNPKPNKWYEFDIKQWHVAIAGLKIPAFGERGERTLLMRGNSLWLIS